MKTKNKKMKQVKEAKPINYKVTSGVLIALMLISIIALVLIIIFSITQKLPKFALIFFTILPIILLLIIFFLSRNMYKDILEFERKYNNYNKKLDKKIEKKEEQKRKTRLSREEEII